MQRPTEPIGEVVHDANGRVRYAGWRLDGELHGAWSWYRVDGTLLRTGEFDRGRQVGTAWRTYSRSGSLAREARFG